MENVKKPLLNKKLFERVVALFMVFVMVVGLYHPPKAKAVVATGTAIVTVAACFLASCGITWLVQGADETGFNDAVGGLLQDYLDTEFAGQTVTEWAGDFTGIAMSGSKLLLPKLIAQKLGAFAGWVVNKYWADGKTEDITLSGNPHIKYYQGISVFVLGALPNGFATEAGYINSLGTMPWIDVPHDATDSAPFTLFGGKYLFYFSPDGVLHYRFGSSWSTYGNAFAVDRVGFIYLENSNRLYIALYSVASGYAGGIYMRTYLDYPLCNDIIDNLVSSANVAISPSEAIDTTKPSTMADDESIAIDTAITAGTLAELLERINAALRANELTTTQEIVNDVVEPGNPELSWTDTLWGWLTGIKDAIIGLPTAIANSVGALFVPDAVLVDEITTTFFSKFGFLPQLYDIFSDIFTFTPDSEPPCIYIYLQNAEGKYNYGGPVKALDLTWYSRYKPTVDILISGFLWLAFLWLCFKRASAIIQGADMVEGHLTYLDGIPDLETGQKRLGGKKR